LSERAVCIHGHFYQPPRENPWLETVEVQDSAYPYHDWNERVTAECYGPNATARILTSEGTSEGSSEGASGGSGDRDGRRWIDRIVNNYARMSFNFGPTLLSWMELERPEVYAAVLEADRLSAARFSGHGSALAQAHSHLIMPLANRRDKETQIVWGLRDFEHRFGREPEGMWLPETAVDLESLDLMAAHGLRFTVLAPHQAGRFRSIDPASGKPSGDWQEVGDGIDPTRPYLCRIPSGRSIALFFYDGAIARAVAFEDLLEDGARFTRRLLSGFADDREDPQLVHIATDGETYGHHHAHGEMALAWTLDALERDESVDLTNYGEHLERHPPVHEVEIREQTSWSCAHGIERWRSDCGCHTGGRPGWNQRWRAPLREALDWLRDDLAPRFEQAAGELLHDPWAARDDYIAVLVERNDRREERLAAFFDRHARRELSEEERIRVRYLMELQRHALFMYTSCGWFFNDLSGIETVQILQYAGRALQLAERLFRNGYEEGFLDRLARAESNVPSSAGGGTGRDLYEHAVRPARVDLTKVAAHYALSTLFEHYPEHAQIFCYQADQKAVRTWGSGRSQLAVGRLEVASLVTGSHQEVSFAVLHFGDHHVNGGVRSFQGDDAFEEMVTAVSAAFQSADVAQVVRLLDHFFQELTYTLDSLFTDERRTVLEVILESTREAAEAHHRLLYEDHAPLMQYLSGLGIPLPRALKAAAEVVLNLDLRSAFLDPDSDLDEVRQKLHETASWHLELDVPGLTLALQSALEELARGLAETLRSQPRDLDTLERLDARVALARSLPFPVPLAGTQNAVYRLLQGEYQAALDEAADGNEDAAAWAERFRALAERLDLRVKAPGAVS